MQRLLREPLLHFLVLGAALFAGYRLLNPEPGRDPQQIVVSAGQIEYLHTTFIHTWQRQPNEAEMKALIDQYVREEVLSREAIKLGLDQNDTVIRRRLQQKMEFITDDMASAAEPSDAELAAWYAQHPEPFREDPRFTFRQVYLNREQRGSGIDTDAAKLLAELNAGGLAGEAAELGDPSLLPAALDGEPQSVVEAAFGAEFANAVSGLPMGKWSGPISSTVGAHLVLVEGRTEGRVPPFAHVRDLVKREWENSLRLEANRRFLDNLLQQYRVTVEWPEPAAALVEK